MAHKIVKTSQTGEHGPVLRDQIIRLASRKALQAQLPEIRRVEYRDPETGRVYVFLTSHRRWTTQTVADIWKARWEVEPFFKWIKRNLKIRRVLGHSMKTVSSQIFVALCGYLPVAFQKFASRSAMGIPAVLRLVQLSLFQRKPLANLLLDRKQDPPNPQMPLGLRAA